MYLIIVHLQNISHSSNAFERISSKCEAGKIEKVDDRDANSCYAILLEVMGNITFRRAWQNTCCSPWFLKLIYYSIVVIGIIGKQTSSLNSGRLSFCWDKLQNLASVNCLGKQKRMTTTRAVYIHIFSRKDLILNLLNKFIDYHC